VAAGARRRPAPTPRRRRCAQWWFFGQFCQILSARPASAPPSRVEMLSHCPRGPRFCRDGTTDALRILRTPKDAHMNKLLSSLGVAIAVAAVSLLAGCQLYFGSSGSSGGSGGGANGGGGKQDRVKASLILVGLARHDDKEALASLLELKKQMDKKEWEALRVQLQARPIDTSSIPSRFTTHPDPALHG